MKSPKHLDFAANFPRNLYRKPTPNQEQAFVFISNHESLTLELPTGTGKTAIGYTFLKTLAEAGHGPLYYTVPNKTLVDQIKKLHPDVKVMYGRNEYPCLYYRRDEVSADAAPCSLLDCPHRVDVETGEIEVGGVEACPYLMAKYEAKQGGIIVCTMAFYLFTHLFSGDWGETAGLVIDEVHQLARVFRNSLSYEITDYHLDRAVELLGVMGGEEARILKNFRDKMMKVVKARPPKTATLLETHEISELLSELYRIDAGAFKRSIRQAVKSGVIDAIEQREVLKKTETIARSLTRYLKSLEYSLPTDKHKPLNYTYGYYEKEIGENGKAQYRLVIKAYYVAPLIQKILAPRTLAYSATIGDKDTFAFETGIKFPFYSLASDFPVENTRIYVPTDTPNLAMKSRQRQDLTRSLRKIAKACKTFADVGHRSFVVVVSNAERQKFMELAMEEGVRTISYGNGVKPRVAAEKFKNGEGDVLVGTVANYGEGVDLPKDVAHVTFHLRPGYAHPNDPATIFEERRFGSMRWRIWSWRVILEALQVRGRNVRSAKDVGVTIFVSQQFRRFLPATLPAWLQEAFDGQKTWDKCIEDAKKILK